MLRAAGGGEETGSASYPLASYPLNDDLRQPPELRRPIRRDRTVVTDNLDDLTIRFPARGGYLGISRLNTTAMAAAAGFDVEQLDDLRLAIDEAVTWLLADDGGGSVELTIRSGSDQIEFRGTRSLAGLPERELNDLMQAIFGATVDSVDAGLDESGHRYIQLVKQRTSDG